MDVHPPHKPIHSVREFLVHLLAITIGLLIALGLESSVEWVHHRHLAQDARENINQEMRDNRQALLKHLNELPAEVEHLQEILSLVNDVESGRPHKGLQEFKWTNPLLSDSSWNAASTTGAIAYMDYAQVKQYSKVYTAQKIYSSFMERNLEERRQMFAFFERMNAPGKLSHDEFEAGRRIILSEIVTAKVFHELDNSLNASYSRILPQEN